MIKYYDVIYLKDELNGYEITPIPMKGCVDYQTALETKTELDKVYNPDRIVIWEISDEFLPVWMKEGKEFPEYFGAVRYKIGTTYLMTQNIK
jgi:hypothetical protein